MADRYDDQYSNPEALRLARSFGAAPKGRLTASNPDLTASNAALAKQMAARMAAQQAAPRQESYELARDADGNTVLVPSAPAAPKQDRNRFVEGVTEGFGSQPLSGVSEQDRANYPTMSKYMDPIAKALNAVSRVPGAVTGGASGAYGAGVEAATGDTGYANAEQRRMREFLDYLGINSAATVGGPRASAPTPKVNPTTQYAMRYESMPSEGSIGPVQAPIGSARNPEMGGQAYSQNVARQAHIDNIIKNAAGDTAQTRQNSAVQNAIDAAAQRAREGMPREMNADEIAAMQRSFAAANPSPANPMSLPVATGTILAGAMTRPGVGVMGRQAPVDVDEGHLDPNLFGVRYPTSGMDRTNTLGVDELSAYPAGAVHNYNRNDSAGVNEMGAYSSSPVQLAKRSLSGPVASSNFNAGKPIDLTSGQDVSRPGILSRLFSGPEYQSTGERVVKEDGQGVNYGSGDNAADFFRADKARMAMEGKAGGGGVSGKPDKDAALHKALEIIHHMIRSR
jgi:hypothetical protein